MIAAVPFDVRPHDGVGPLLLGMTRGECRAAAGGEVSEYLKRVDDDRTTDVLLSGVHVFYDGEDRAEYIEVSRDTSVQPLFDDVALLEVAPAEAVGVVERHASFDDADPELGYSYVFPALDLALWRPVDSDEELEGATFATVGVGRRGYF